MTAPEPPPPAAGGALEHLFALAREGRLDVARLSAGALAGQAAEALEAALRGGRVPLAQAAEWVVMAASLVALRSRLLLPEAAPGLPEAREEAEALRRRLLRRRDAARLADWLEARPQLGRDRFGRGRAEPGLSPAPRQDLGDFVIGLLRAMEPRGAAHAWRPRPPPLWQPGEALAHLRHALAATAAPVPLRALLPSPGRAGASAVQRRAALASSFAAALELVRQGEAAVRQDAEFGRITLAREAPTCQET